MDNKRERLLFFVSVDKADASNWQHLRQSDTTSLIEAINLRLQANQTSLDIHATLLAIDSYLDQFVGIIELDAAALAVSGAAKASGWDLQDAIVQSLLRSILGISEQSVTFVPYRQASPLAAANVTDPNLTWSLLRLKEVCDEDQSGLALLGMKGISSRG